MECFFFLCLKESISGIRSLHTLMIFIKEIQNVQVHEKINLGELAGL